MKRAFIITGLLLPYWLGLFLVPSIADEFKFRDFGISNYPGWTDAQLFSWGIGMAVLLHSFALLSLRLFHRAPPPLLAPRMFAWTFAFITFVGQIVGSLMKAVPLNLGMAVSGLGIYYLFTGRSFRFWEGSRNGSASPSCEISQK